VPSGRAMPGVRQTRCDRICDQAKAMCGEAKMAFAPESGIVTSKLAQG